MPNEKMIQEIKSYCLNKPGAYETRPFGKYPICYRLMGKIFAQFNPETNFFRLTLKCNPEQSYIYRQIYQDIVVRGYHCPPVQQPYWNTINLDVFSDIKMLYKMIDEAYEEIVGKLSGKAKKQLSELLELEFKYTNGEDHDFVMLCNKLDYALDELAIHNVIVVYCKGKPVGCGSFKMYDEEHAELKRIYTEPICRGIGLGVEIVRRLEAVAKMEGYKWCILETGEPLGAACHIYKKMGYKVIPNYGQYVNMPESICMQRKI